MQIPKKVRITCKGQPSEHDIVDAETGEPIPLVNHVLIEMGPMGPPTATIRRYLSAADLDVTADARIVVFCPDCGRDQAPYVELLQKRDQRIKELEQNLLIARAEVQRERE